VDYQRQQGLKQQGDRRRGHPLPPKGSIIKQSFTLGFPTTNNEAEYEAVITGLRIAATFGIIGLEVHSDSTLVVCQVNKQYTAKHERIKAYLQLVFSLKAKFSRCDFKRISRSENNHTDLLAN